jgi:hypothetical protein
MTTVFNALKEVYESSLADQIQSDTVTLQRIVRTSKGVGTNAVGGKHIKFPIRVKRNHGIGARAEMQPLPNPRTQGYESVELDLKYLYGAVQLTGQNFELAVTDKQSFINVVEAELNGMRETLAKDANRQVYGTTAGILATASEAGDTDTFTTTNVQYLEVGMIVDVWDESGSPDAIFTGGSEVEIENIIDNGDGTWDVELDTTLTGSTAAGDYLTRHGNFGLEKTGFTDIVIGPNEDGTGALYGVTHSTWTGNVTDVSGNLSEGVMINMVNKIRRRGSIPTVAFTTLGIQTAYFNLLHQQRRFTNTIDFAGGYKGLAFTVGPTDIPIVSDLDCPPGDMFFINEKEIKLYQAGEWSFLDRDGGKWTRVQDANGRYDAYLADYYKYCEMGTFRRNAHGALINVSEVSV